MRSILQRRPRRAGCGLLLIAGLAAAASPGAETAFIEPLTVVTNILQLRSLAASEPLANYAFQLEGNVWWSSPTQNRIVLQDASGAEEMEASLPGPSPKAGDRVRLTGTGSIVGKGAVYRLGARGPVVDHDGVHSLTEKSGSLYLVAGRHPIALDWFNGTGRSGLRLEYDGPGILRQAIPDSALYRTPQAASKPDATKGLDYRAYEGAWQNLPDFSLLAPVKTGTLPNFTLTGRTREHNVGLQFTGRIEVLREGMYSFYLKSDDGSRLFVGEPTLQLSVLGRTEFPSPRQITIGQLWPDGEADDGWAQVEGKVTLVRPQPGGLLLELRAGAGSMRVEVADDSGLSAARWLNRRIRATGFCRRSYNLEGERVAGVLLVPGVEQIELLDATLIREMSDTAGPNANALPLLTSASAVRELKPEEARRGYPVRIQGVVTCVQPDHQAFVIQDSTCGLYMTIPSTRQSDLPNVGEFLEIAGKTDEPGITKLREVRRLGEGNMPEPVHPAWDQLMNGSLDSQWVEMSGLVESLIDRSNGWMRVMLRTRAGVLKVDLRRAGVRPGPLEQYENAAVRLRGCMFADWSQTRRLKVGQIRMFDVDLFVDQPAPADLFSVPRTTAAALMQFDPSFDVSHRVKVSGQVVYVRGADYFMMDGNEGIRFMAKQPLGLEGGDLVEAVGYPELSGAAPVLRGAVARKTGRAALPEPKRLAPDDLIRSSLDATRVRIAGLLQGMRQTRTNLVLEMQSGSWRFLARLNSPGLAPSFSVGSQLELTGVYCAQGGLLALGADVAPVDLLLGQLADITVLARPPWWTLQRLLVIVGLLACALAVTVLWITQLRRQVEERTAELGIQIQNRQQVEHQREMEQERARIAQDLHDELGSDIATISMLAARAQFASAPDEKRSQHLDQVRGKAREMVAALDEIVWAMNPGHDSLTSMMGYIGQYADRFLGLANIAWHFEGPPETADHPMDSRQRHQLFLVFKEALTNVVRHSGATEVALSARIERDELRLAVADNGRGLAGERNGESNGVTNMRARIEKLKGRFEIIGEPGRGTTVRFSVPLNSKP